jgi:hypothetical protein
MNSTMKKQDEQGLDIGDSTSIKTSFMCCVIEH